ncbi:MAG TPA: GWxTD domain-containing protein [Methylomirabilota bacterium]|nr:GWxTD domain-containing protein [Methylomirabilota bacterium]
MFARILLLSLAILIPALSRAAVALPASPKPRQSEADRLLADAERRLTHHTFESRRVAIRELEEACELEPQRVDLMLRLARTYADAGFTKQSRLRFERALKIAPDNAEARMGLGYAWRRDWLKYLERRSLDRAIEHFAASARLDPQRSDAWLMVSALEVEKNDLPAARAAAEHALDADHVRADCLLAGASLRWRQGDVGGADSLFRIAFTRLRRSVRDRFEDFAPLVTEQDTTAFGQLPMNQRAEFVRRFWSENDPDLVTPENEAQLEYWARVAQAYFLFYDPVHREWDERGDIYVRYGPPQAVTYNPVGTGLYGIRGGANQVAFPVNVLVWAYPQLGMVAVMQDRSLNGRYELPPAWDHDTDPIPDPVVVANLDVVTTRGLKGVFPTLPPGARPIEVSSQIARFEGERGTPSLFAGVAAPGNPTDTLMADIVVLDSTMREVARLRRPLSPSACDAGGLRVADFQLPLGPGDYVVGTSVRGGGRRGARREFLHVPAIDSVLSVSDLLVTCGVPPVLENSVQLDANPSGRVPPGQPLVAYFEVYHLARDPEGQGRFEYETAVHSAAADNRMWFQRWLSPRREGEGLGVTRQDAVLGTVRRQFVSVPVRSLAPGNYRLDLIVRDVLTGDEQKRSAFFTREPDAR